jgi:2-octaprenyl-6-methoxyphenol hydroxylase
MQTAPERRSDVDCDIAIVGGGLVGASLALALTGLGLSITLIEAVLPEEESQPSFDTRTTALSNGSRRVFEGLGVWDEIAREATAIRQIHVSERGRFGSAVIDAAEQGIPALGFVVENRVVGQRCGGGFGMPQSCGCGHLRKWRRPPLQPMCPV